jgi:hypothetical protein
MRPSTLESKIRSLGINKHAWKTIRPGDDATA